MGKTTLVKHLLAPRMPDARIVCLESTNAGSDEITSAIRLNADDEFGSLVDILAIEDELIVDLGSSEAKEMIRKLKEYESAIQEFDYVLVPVIPDPKAIEDTISTVMTLHALNVPPERIRILFNRVPVHMADKIRIIFSQLIDTVEGKATIDTSLVIFQYEIYNALKGSSTNVTDVVTDQKDWKSIARDISLSESTRIEALQNNRNQKAAPTALRNLDAVFDALLSV
jgi:MinD-like ATPase involved in chromosome partitioning or flagellar assembly